MSRFIFSLLVGLAWLETTAGQPPKEKNAVGTVPLKIDASPAVGFHHPYLLLVPQKVRANAPIVVALPTPPTSEKPADFLAAAERMIKNAGPMLNALESPVLTPVTPRPPLRLPNATINIYLPALSREAMLTKDLSLARFDRQVLAMIEDARRRVKAERNVDVNDRAAFVGFSAGGHFATRMAVLHPERVAAVWAGGTGGHPILPVAEIERRTLTFPLGIADLKEVSGRDFNAAAFAKVPMLIAQGSADANTSLPSADRPSESYSKEQGTLALQLLGSTNLERFAKAKEAYRQGGANAEFRIYDGVPHRITPEMAKDIVKFLRESAK